MSPKTVSRNALDGDIVKIRRGLAIYKLHSSPFYYVRMRNPKTRRYTVKSSKETSRVKAREVAEELYNDFLNGSGVKSAPKQYAFRSYAEKYLQQCDDYIARGIRNQSYKKDALFAFESKRLGLTRYFGDYDVREITTAHFNDYLRQASAKDKPLSRSLIALLTSHFRNTLKVALNDGVISAIPLTPKPKTEKQTPRPFFRFSPIVDKPHDQYRLVCETIRQLSGEGIKVRGVELTLELLDLVQFLTNTFLRPIRSELYAIKHEDVVMEEIGTSRTLRLTVRKGKTGARISTSMEAAVGIYQRIQKRYPDHKPTDYLFYPQYQNRAHAVRIAQNLLNHVLNVAGLSVDPYTKQKHTMYSFRHTAICMRLVLSKGKINIYTLAKNAGTSVEMIESNYAKRLPIMGALVENLQSFGE